MTVFLYDNFPIKTATITDAGFLRFVAPIARTGKFPYIDKKTGKIYYQTVSDKVLVDSAESFKMVPVTSPHPPVKITPENARNYTRGSTGHGYVFDNAFLWFTGTIYDKNVIDNIKSKRVTQLSTGYDALLKKINNDSGEDVREQIKRIGNHLSVIELARHGSSVAINYDSVDLEDFLYSTELFDASEIPDIPEELDRIIQFDNADKPKYFTLNQKSDIITGNSQMTQILYKGVIYTVEGDSANQLRDVLIADQSAQDTLEKNLDSAENKAKVAEDLVKQKDIELSNLQGQLDSVKVELDKIKSQSQADSTVDISKELANRLNVWKQVIPAMRKADPKFEMDASLSTIDIKKSYLKVKYPSLATNLDSLDLTDDSKIAYLDGLYDSAIANDSTQEESTKKPTVVNSVFDSLFNTPGSIETESNADEVDYRAEMIAALNKQLGSR